MWALPNRTEERQFCRLSWKYCCERPPFLPHDSRPPGPPKYVALSFLSNCISCCKRRAVEAGSDLNRQQIGKIAVSDVIHRNKSIALPVELPASYMAASVFIPCGKELRIKNPPIARSRTWRSYAATHTVLPLHHDGIGDRSWKRESDSKGKG